MKRAIFSLANPTIPCAMVTVALRAIPYTMVGQDVATPPPPDYVSRAEYDKLKAEHEAMKQELEALKTAVRQMANGTVPAVPAEGPTKTAPEGKQVVSATASQAATDELRQEVETLKTQVKETF